MPRFKRGKNLNEWSSNRAEAGHGKLRIVGGKFKGRQIDYSGDPVTRPMKDNIREAVFNLVGGWIKGKVIFDLFAGTGAMGLEAISRGAAEANFIERHIPTVRIVEANVRALGVEEFSNVDSSDTFFWVRQFLKRPELPTAPWVVFCCPPYSFYIDREQEVLGMLESLLAVAPDQSIFVVESDARFDPSRLPLAERWVVRKYAPALVSVYHKLPAEPDDSP